MCLCEECICLEIVHHTSIGSETTFHHWKHGNDTSFLNECIFLNAEEQNHLSFCCFVSLKLKSKTLKPVTSTTDITAEKYLNLLGCQQLVPIDLSFMVTLY